MEDVFPVEVRLKEDEGTLTLTWSDDHISTLTLAYARGWCPCAVCQGHFTGEWRFIETSHLGLRNVEPVGNYGMRMIWSDGHDTGIYQFDYLRGICPCGDCDPEGVRVTERIRPKTAMGGFSRS